MPSWITHLVTANKIYDKLKIEDKNSFLFGNIMPDILENYIVKNTTVHRKYEITHFTDDLIINGIKYAFPNPNKFVLKYQNKFDNPVIYGFYIHLLTDYFWNKVSYEQLFKNHNGLVEVTFLDGTSKDYEFNQAIKLKQADFKIFTQYLREQNMLNDIIYTDELLNFSKEISEIPLTKNDIQNTIKEVDKYLNDKIEQNNNTYKLFTQNRLDSYLDESIKFIMEKINRK